MNRVWNLFTVVAVTLTLAVALPSFGEAQHGKKQGIVDSVSGQGYGAAGCGLGSIMFGSKPGLIQVLAATFNGTFGSQTFGITTGTSNCEAHDGRHAENYILANRESLETDASRGAGETISNLAALMGCSDVALFNGKVQENYSTIFPSTTTDAKAVAGSIRSTIANDQALAHSCVVRG